MFDGMIDTCKHNQVPTEIVRKIMKVESSKNQLSINVNHDGKSLVSFNPKTKLEAKKIAIEWMNKGYTVDVGLMQLNSENFSKFNISIDEALEPCTNIKVASTIYNNFYKLTNKNDNEILRIQQALSGYNTGNLLNGFKNGYVAKYEISSSDLVAVVDKKELKKYAESLLAMRFSVGGKISLSTLRNSNIN